MKRDYGEIDLAESGKDEKMLQRKEWVSAMFGPHGRIMKGAGPSVSRISYQSDRVQ